MEFTKEKPLRVFEAFAGYGSQALALERLHRDYPDFCFEVVGISEIDKYAIQAYNAIHGETKNYGDISKIDWNGVPDFDFFTYSSPCFVAGTLVLTSKGYMPIENVSVGDMVMTHTNTFQKVTKTYAKPFKGKLYDIKAMNLHSLICTEEHPFYVRRMFRKGHEMVRSFHEPEWIKAKNLDTNCYIGYAVNKESKLPEWNGVEDNRFGHHNISNKLSDCISKDALWYIMGRYVGDGWKKEDSGIVIACSDRNKQSLEHHLELLGWNYNMCFEKTCYRATIYSKELANFVERYGYMSYAKHIDVETMNLPVDLLMSFIQGYIDSDGCFTEGIFKACTVSEELVYGMAQCIAKAYSRPFSIYKTRRKPKTVIEGRVVNQKDTYQVTWKRTTDIQDKAFYEDGYVWFPINQLPKHELAVSMVYNLEVENDNSYTANGCIVHNCTDISLAGQQRGLAKGSGTRSSLLWECEKAIDIKRPKYLLMENVSAITSAKFLPHLNSWQVVLEEYGYKQYAAILNAKNHGVPQNRERFFFFSVHESAELKNYYFPTSVPLEKRLIDVLEKNVDEKYYVDANVEKALNIIGKKEPDDTILGSLQGHASTQPIEGGVSPTLGTTDFGLPKVLRNEP